MLIGGVGTVSWDVWLQQSIGKMRANWTAKRRRAEHQERDVEEIRSSQIIPLEEHEQVAATNLTQRRAPAEDLGRNASTERDLTRQISSGNGFAGENPDSTGAAPIADTTTHNISVKLGVAIITGFLGVLSSLHLCLFLT